MSESPASRPPRSRWHWIIFLCVAVAFSLIQQQLNGYGFSFSPVYFAGVLGGAAPAFSVALLIGFFVRGRQGLIIGLAVLLLMELSVTWTAYQDMLQRQR
jgi:drug/metabolite transporter (DMT)-like permease